MADLKYMSRPWLRPGLIFLWFILAFAKFWNGTVIFRDSFRLYAPFKFLVAQGWREGRLMAWNPYQYLGTPLIADVLAGYFYPLNVLYLILPFEPAHRVFILIHYPLAAIFMDLLLRELKLSKNASALGALAFSMSGYLISQHANLVYLIGPAWAPLAIYCFLRSREGQLHWAAAAGAVLALQVLGGEPQSAALAAGLIFIIGLFQVLARRRPVFSMAAILGAGLCSLALAACQLFPSSELFTRSIRAGGLTLSESSLLSYHPGAMIEFIWPAPFGVIWPAFRYWGQFSLDTAMMNNPWAITNYLGLPVFVLAGIGVSRSRRPWKIAIGLGALLFLVLAFGHFTPGFGWASRLVPVLSWFRFPCKYLAGFTGFMAVAAALGWEKMEEWFKSRPSGLAKGALVYLAVIALGTVIAAEAWPLALKGPLNLRDDPKTYEFAVAHLLATGAEWALVNLAAAAIVFLIAKGRLTSRTGTGLFLAVLGLDFFFANVGSMPAAPPRIFSFTPVAAKVISPSGRPPLGQFRIYQTPNMDYRDINPALKKFPEQVRQNIWQRSVLTPNFDNMEGFENVTGYTATRLAQGDEVLWGDLTIPRMKLYNGVYMINHYNALPPGVGSLELMANDPVNDLMVARFKDAWPRAYWVPAGRWAKDDAEAVSLLDSTDLRRLVIITAATAPPADPPSERTLVPARIARYNDREIEVVSEADAPGWLVLSDRIYPGWSAEADGKPEPIYTANVMVRAVHLPAGKHTVVFRFQSRPVRLGAMISIPAWIVVVLWWAEAWWRGRKRIVD